MTKKANISDFFASVISMVLLLLIVALGIALWVGGKQVERHIVEDALAVAISRASLSSLQMPTDRLFVTHPDVLSALDKNPHIEDQREEVVQTILQYKTIGEALSFAGDDEKVRCAVGTLLQTHPLFQGYYFHIYGPDEEISIYDQYISEYDVSLIPLSCSTNQCKDRYIAVAVYTKESLYGDVCA